MIIIGDTHCLKPIFELIERNKWENKNLIHVGDLGLGFQEIARDVSNLKILDEALIHTNNHLYLIRGNHDFKLFWDKSMGLYLPKFHNLHLMDDNTIKTIEEKVVFFSGGAISIDRSLRKCDIPHPSWDLNENFTPSNGIMSIYPKDTIDIIITHSCPDFCYPRNNNVPIVNDWHNEELKIGNNLKRELSTERREITKLAEEIGIYQKSVTHWFYGHFHTSKTEIIDNITYKLLNINETYELK